MIDNPPVYDDIKVDVSAKNDSYSQVYRLNVSSQTPREDEHGDYSVSGKIENNTSKDLQSATVYVWLLEKDNKVVGLSTTYVDNINKGTKKPYEASFYFSQGEKPNIKTIKVLAESTH